MDKDDWEDIAIFALVFALASLITSAAIVVTLGR